jgi:hypothetical protein
VHGVANRLWDTPAVVGAATPVGDFSKGIIQFEDAIA